MKKVIGWIFIILGILGILATFCILPLGGLGAVPICPWLPGPVFFMLYPSSFLAEEVSNINESIAVFVYYGFYLLFVIIGVILVRDKPLILK